MADATETSAQNSFEVLLNNEVPHIDFRYLGSFEGKNIDFPDIPFFGFANAQATQQMAWVLMSYEDVNEEGLKLAEQDAVVDTPYNRRVMWLAAFFHNLGRTVADWRKPDKGCARRSAQMMRAVFEQYPELAAEKSGQLMQDVLELIENRDTGEGPLHKCLREAIRFEVARFSPNTKDAAALVNKTRRECETAFGKEDATWKRYMRSKKWLVE